MTSGYKARKMINTLTGKGFDAIKGTHKRLFLMDEHGARTSVSTGFSGGGHGREIDTSMFCKIARELCMKRKELECYLECTKTHEWLLKSLREQNIIE